MIKNIRHLGLRVNNLDKAIYFYRKLGLNVVSRQKEHWQDAQALDICKLRAPPALVWPENTSIEALGLYHGPLIELVQGDWFNHIAVTVDSLDELSWGHVVHQRPGCKVCFVPDGRAGGFVELVEEG